MLCYLVYNLFLFFCLSIGLRWAEKCLKHRFFIYSRKKKVKKSKKKKICEYTRV